MFFGFLVETNFLIKKSANYRAKFYCIGTFHYISFIEVTPKQESYIQVHEMNSKGKKKQTKC